MLFWALLASGQISMRKVDGWQTLATKPIDQPIDLAALSDSVTSLEIPLRQFQPHSTFDSISHPIGQDPMILCINAQAASSGDLAQGFAFLGT
jgi:hypothetical protein